MAKEQRMMCVEDFKENLCRYCNTYMSEEPCEPSECWVHDVIAQTGTVEAVEVVRCKECKKIMPSVTPIKDAVWCREFRAYMPCDGFCSYGERREGE